MEEALKDRIKKILPEIVDLRHEFHEIPEIAFEEKKTALKIREYLKALDIKILPPYMETDTVALIEGKEPGKTIMLRADIDALPIKEATSVSYHSVHDGFSHSCGHDGHIAVLLGTAKILSEMKDNLHGTVKLVFQPGEENKAGGRILVEKGVLLSPDVCEGYALHGWPGLETGFAETCRGVIMAAADDFSITLTGNGGHGAAPHLSCDLIFAAAQFITSVQSVISRQTDPLDSGVISVCMIEGGTAFNVLPDKVVLRGTYRYLKKETGAKIQKYISDIIESCVKNNGGKYELKYYSGDYIPLVNSSEKAAFWKNIAEKYLGKENCSTEGVPSMCAEDFACYLDKVPGVYFRLGMGKNSPPLHNPEFDFNDNAVENGIALMCGIALERLKK